MRSARLKPGGLVAHRTTVLASSTQAQSMHKCLKGMHQVNTAMCSTLWSAYVAAHTVLYSDAISLHHDILLCSHLQVPCIRNLSEPKPTWLANPRLIIQLEHYMQSKSWRCCSSCKMVGRSSSRIREMLFLSAVNSCPCSSEKLSSHKACNGQCCSDNAVVARLLIHPATAQDKSELLLVHRHV